MNRFVITLIMALTMLSLMMRIIRHPDLGVTRPPVFSRPPVFRPHKWHDLPLSQVDFIKTTKLSEETRCTFNIPCPNIVAIERIENGHIVKNLNGLIYDENKGKHSYGYWFWDNKHVTRPSVPVKRIDRAVSFVRIYEDTFQHSAFGSFLKARYHCDWLTNDAGMKLIVFGDVQKKVLQYACPSVPDHRYVYITSPEVHVDELFVIHFAADMDRPQSRVISLAASPPGIITLPSDNKLDTLVYLKRGRALGKRFVMNDNEVMETLRSFASSEGLEFKVFDKSSQRSLFSRAAYIVGPHGGAFGNIIYASAGTKIIEFITAAGMQKRPCYPLLAWSLSLSYTFVSPTPFNFDSGGMRIDVTDLESALYK